MTWARQGRNTISLICYVFLVSLQAWVGRKHIFLAPDWHYVTAFCLFSALFGILLFAFQFFRKKASQAKSGASFGTLQLQAGTLFGLFVASYWFFNDYTTSHLTAASMIETIVLSIVVGSVMGYSIKPASSKAN